MYAVASLHCRKTQGYAGKSVIMPMRSDGVGGLERGTRIMKKSTVLCTAITILMLSYAALAFFGKGELYIGMGSITYYFRDAFLAPAETSFRPSFIVCLWAALITGILTPVFAWIRRPWSSLLAALACFAGVFFYIRNSLIAQYGIFDFDSLTDAALLLIPLASLVLCIILFMQIRDER